MLFRESLCAFLGNTLPARVVGAGSGKEALSLLRHHAWEVLLLDIELGDMSGLDILRHGLAMQRSLSVIMLSLRNDPATVRACFADGAMGYVTKEDASVDVMSALAAARAGKRFISPRAAAALTQSQIVQTQGPA